MHTFINAHLNKIASTLPESHLVWSKYYLDLTSLKSVWVKMHSNAQSSVMFKFIHTFKRFRLYMYMLYMYMYKVLRVQCHAHACILGWLLGDCISETTADIPRNQRPMLQDWQRLYTRQTMSAENARRKRDGRG